MIKLKCRWTIAIVALLFVGVVAAIVVSKYRPAVKNVLSNSLAIKDAIDFFERANTSDLKSLQEATQPFDITHREYRVRQWQKSVQYLKHGLSAAEPTLAMFTPENGGSWVISMLWIGPANAADVFEVQLVSGDGEVFARCSGEVLSGRHRPGMPPDAASSLIHTRSLRLLPPGHSPDVSVDRPVFVANRPPRLNDGMRMLRVDKTISTTAPIYLYGERATTEQP